MNKKPKNKLKNLAIDFCYIIALGMAVLLVVWGYYQIKPEKPTVINNYNYYW